MSDAPLLAVRDLVVEYPGRAGGPPVRAVDGVSFDLVRGRTLGLVGESGCGKSTTGRAILRLQPAHSGTVAIGGRDILTLRGAELLAFRRRAQIVFQDPFSSLNPRLTVQATIAEALWLHRRVPRSRIAARVAVTDAGKVTILGVPIDAVTYESAEARMDEMIRSGRAHHIFTADVSGIMRAREEPELAEIIRTSDLVTADGAGVLWAARLFDFPLPERVSGVDLVRRLSGLAAREGYRVYLLGAAPGVAHDAAERLMAENPGLTIAGVRDGYFDDEAAVAEELRAARPDILFVALGIPKQERFIRRWYHELNIPLSIGIGGSFDVISGRLQRAPGWMQRAGLEWLFRVAQEPKRWRRLAALPRFVLAIGLDAAQQWRARGRHGESTE